MTENKGKNKKNLSAQKLKWFRNLVQLLFFILAPSLFSQAFGGIKEIFVSIGNGDTLVISSFVVKTIVLIVLTILFGRIFCGWMCAFGALGDWIFQFSEFVQKKTGIKAPKLRDHIVIRMQKIKYIVLMIVLFLCFAGKSEIVTKNSPWTLFSLFSVGNIRIAGYFVAAVLLIAIIMGMAIQERFFCQFLCPLGAIFTMLPEIPMFQLKRDEKKCIPNCQLCKRKCPVKIKLDEDVLREGECVKCGRCANGCPRKSIHVMNNNNLCVEKKAKMTYNKPQKLPDSGCI